MINSYVWENSVCGEVYVLGIGMFFQLHSEMG